MSIPFICRTATTQDAAASPSVSAAAAGAADLPLLMAVTRTVFSATVPMMAISVSTLSSNRTVAISYSNRLVASICYPVVQFPRPGNELALCELTDPYLRERSNRGPDRESRHRVPSK